MAAGVDAIRELEWGDMADTVLVFVRSPPASPLGLPRLTLGVGRSLCSIPLRVPALHHHPTPTRQHRDIEEHPAPYVSSTQRLCLMCI